MLFAVGKSCRVNNNAALASAVGNIGNSAFECHPSLQSLNFVNIDVLMITDSALCGAAYRRMLNAITFKYLYAAVVHSYRNRNGEFSLGVLHSFVFRRLVAENIRCVFNCCEHVVIRIITHYLTLHSSFVGEYKFTLILYYSFFTFCQ